MKVRVEERIFKLERDEAAFLESIRNINTKQATSINQFLLARTGGYGMRGDEDQYSQQDFSHIIKKRKILESTRLIIERTLSIESDLLTADTPISDSRNFNFYLDPPGTTIQEFNVTGKMMISSNKFTQMPRG